MQTVQGGREGEGCQTDVWWMAAQQSDYTSTQSLLTILATHVVNLRKNISMLYFDGKPTQGSAKIATQEGR